MFFGGMRLVKYVVKDFIVAVAVTAACYVFWIAFCNDYERVVKEARVPNDFVLENFAHMMGPSIEEAVVGTGDMLERAIE